MKRERAQQRNSDIRRAVNREGLSVQTGKQDGQRYRVKGRQRRSDTGRGDDVAIKTKSERHC